MYKQRYKHLIKNKNALSFKNEKTAIFLQNLNIIHRKSTNYT